MNIQIEVSKQRRVISEKGFKIYGTAEELKQIVSDIEVALSKGLVQGWVGIGTVDDKSTVFPNNGKPDVETKGWKD